MEAFRIKFTEEDVDNAKKYKYNGTDKSIFAKLFLRRWWDFCINYIPMTIAPNLITLIGFLAEVFSFIVSMFTSKMLAQPIPRWNCFLNGISLFFYQTLDNLDGRQARRTNTSSPLGQFFDHGCDALTGVFELMKFAATLNLGQSPVTFYFVFLMGIGFMYTSLEEYVLHEFNLGVVNGPDEGLFLISIVHVLATITPNWLVVKIFNNVFFYVMFVVGVVLTILPILVNIFNKSKGDTERINRFLIATAYCLIPIVLYLFIGNVLKGCLNNVLFTLSASLTLQFQAQTIIFSFLTKRKPNQLFTNSVITIWGASIVFFLLALITKFLNIFGVLFVGIICLIIMFDIDICFGLSKGLHIPILTIPNEKEEDLNIEIYKNDDEKEEEEEEFQQEEPKEVSMNLFKDVKEE